MAQSMAGSLMLSISYDIDVNRVDDPLIELSQKAAESVAAIGNAGSYLGMC